MESSSLYKSKFAMVMATVVLLWSLPSYGAILWHWEAQFTEAERQKLTYWIDETHSALERFAGPLPFDVHVYMRRRDGGSEPVPWANTRRNTEQALYFYVNPKFSRAEFMDDWTASHEFSHLLLPYLGSSNAWFAEGFASYLQYSVMVESGAISSEEALRRRDRKMRRATEALENAAVSLPANMPDLKKRRSYPTFYWGGAVYFERVDAALIEEGGSLADTLGTYLACCRMRRPSLDTLVKTLDALSGSSVFATELQTMRSTPGVPRRP